VVHALMRTEARAGGGEEGGGGRAVEEGVVVLGWWVVLCCVLWFGLGWGGCVVSLAGAKLSSI